MALTLVIGNKNYSSWSLRPWIGLKAAGVPFEEKLIPLDQETTKPQILALSPAGKVPILIDGDTHVWESLAILDYVAERFPDARLWPDDRRARGHARSIAAEMHAGFGALRNECPMVLWRPVQARELSAQAMADAGRIDTMWSECRKQFGAGGPFLFGRFTAADAMYAPVVTRFETYSVPVSGLAREYMAAVLSHPAFVEWKAAGIREPWVISHDEPDWPTVLKG